MDISVTVMALVLSTLGSLYPARQVDCTSVVTMEWSPTNNSDCVFTHDQYCKFKLKIHVHDY